MLCPVCHSASHRVLDSREGRDGEIRRRRICESCGHRFTTRERIEESLPVVTKRDGGRQAFDRIKLRRGLEIACRKRPVSDEQIEEVVRAIERWAATRGDRELGASEIGERVMHHLYHIDPVAYIRFVSVYRSFDSIEAFFELLREMEKAEKVSHTGQRSLFDSAEPEPPPALTPSKSEKKQGKGKS